MVFDDGSAADSCNLRVFTVDRSAYYRKLSL